MGRSPQSQSRRVSFPPTKVRKNCDLLLICHRRSVLVSSEGLSEIFGFVGSLGTQIAHQTETLRKGNSQRSTIFGENEEGKPQI